MISANLNLLPHHELAGQGDDLEALEPYARGAGHMLCGVSADDVVAGAVFVHEFREHLLDARAFLVDGVVERVGEVVHGVQNLVLVHDFGGGHV